MSKKDTIDINLNEIIAPIAILLLGIMISITLFFVAGKIDFWGSNNNDNKVFVCDQNSPLTDDCLKQYALDLDLDVDDFVECVDDEKYADVITSELKKGTEYRVGGTPSIFLAKGDGDEFRGFSIGSGLEYSMFTEMIDFAIDNSIEDTQKKWIDIQIEGLKDFEVQVREYFESSQGGELKGKELKNAVDETVATRRGDIDTLYEIKDLERGDGVVEGKGEVIVMEFSDYECPYCGDFAKTTLKDIKSEYVSTDKIRFIFRDFPLEDIHPNARNAAEAARCAEEQDKYFEYHDKLFGIN